MYQTIKNAVRTILIHDGATVNLWGECVFPICDACNYIVGAGCTRKPEKILTFAKPSVSHMHAPGCKFWSRVSDKTETVLEEKAKCGVLLRFALFGKYGIMMEDCRSLRITRKCLVREDQFPMKKMENVFRVNRTKLKEQYPDDYNDTVIDVEAQ